MQRGQTFWATPRTLAFTPVRWEPWEGSGSEEIQLDLEEVGGGKDGIEDLWGGYCNGPVRGAGGGTQVVTAEGGEKWLDSGYIFSCFKAFN